MKAEPKDWLARVWDTKAHIASETKRMTMHQRFAWLREQAALSELSKHLKAGRRAERVETASS